ncbi:DUF397 domain-containing protein [Streptomyces beigongshangae]|uniref:DUF397 domain-containing protein n=1 Tax=Streptomyces beigongshangae TaxID=2841597 RepID=UPI0027E18A0A|nr:DUF397 domain-containing protein [Streptomyces sp. REN17]
MSDVSGVHWIKSSFSDEGGNNCVEVAATEDGIALRESESPTEVLSTGPEVLRALLHGVKSQPSGFRPE